jgi:hypothetical protein
MSATIVHKPAASLNQPLSRKAIALIVGAIVLAVLMIWGGYSLFQYLNAGPQKPEKVRAQIRRYLKKQTGQKDFKTVLPARLTNEAPAPPSPMPASRAAAPTIVTNETASRPPGTNTVMRLARQMAQRILGPKQSELTREFRERINAAPDYRTMYRLIGEQLWIVDQLFTNREARRIETGLLLATDTSRVALRDAVNPWLAARIGEGYLWPQVDFAASGGPGRMSVEMVLDAADEAFREAGETNNIIRNGKLLISKAGASPQAEKARVRVAKLLEEQGKYAEALSYLRGARNTNSPVIAQRLAGLEARVRQKEGRN